MSKSMAYRRYYLKQARACFKAGLIFIKRAIFLPKKHKVP